MHRARKGADSPHRRGHWERRDESRGVAGPPSSQAPEPPILESASKKESGRRDELDALTVDRRHADRAGSAGSGGNPGASRPASAGGARDFAARSAAAAPGAPPVG